MAFDDDDLPSLDDIFSKPVKRVKTEAEEVSVIKENQDIIDDKENRDSIIKNDVESKKLPRREEEFNDRPLKLDTPVFVHDLFKGKYVPGIVIEIDKNDQYYKIKCYDGEEVSIGRKYIYCTTDTNFYSITPIPLNEVISLENIMIRPFVKESIVNLVEEEEKVLIKILKGEIESERDLIFRSGKRFLMNSESSPGPFTQEEYNFLLEYFPDVLIPKLLKEVVCELLEERFEKTGTSLNHLLRQYSYLVLVPEFVVRHILRTDSSVKTLKEANYKLLNDSKAYDKETGNFIYYLYSKQEMYRYARRERTTIKVKKGDDDVDID
jgi:hypothetical protein